MDPFDIQAEVEITQTGAQRIRQGHLWVYAADVARTTGNLDGPLVRLVDGARNLLGHAFYSQQSQIRLRVLTRGPEVPSLALLRARISESIRRRNPLATKSSAQRLVFAEADLVPSIIVDRYADYLVLQTLSRGADALKSHLVDILKDLLQPKGILERNDFKARRLEGLEETRGELWGTVPAEVEIEEGGIVFRVDLSQGQKTGFFLDQRENRVAAREYVAGRALDCFANTGAFALHFAARCSTVLAVDVSKESLAQGQKNAERNAIANVEFREGNAFDVLRDLERAGEKFDTVCLDPPAFAKNRASLESARGGYKEINLRAMKLLNPRGILVTSSCSYHLKEMDFFDLICQAARDSHRYVQMIERRSQASDHPSLVSMPETRYLKCFILRAL